MDIKDFIKVIEENEILLLPYATQKPRVDRTVIPHFVPKPQPYKMGQIIYGSETPDIYTTLYLEGSVILKHTNNKYDDTFQTSKFENFALFREGKPVNRTIYIKADEKVILHLRESGLRVGEAQHMTGVYPVNLSDITFDSYKEEGGKYEAYALCGMLQKEMIAKATYKVFKHYHNELDPSSTIQDKNKELRKKYDMNFINILNENHITDKGYNQISKSKKKQLEYEIKIKGFSHLPKVNDVIERVKNKKPQTTAGEIMAQLVDTCENVNTGLKHLNNLIQMNNTNLNFWTQKIKEFKYGMYLEGKWFEEFTEKGDQELMVENWEFKIVYNGN